MKKITYFLWLVCTSLFSGIAAHATSETTLLTTSNGLPGTLSNGQYTFESETLTTKNPFKFMRLTFFDTYGHNTNADNFKFVCISEFYLEKEDGTEIPLTASNFSTNATETLEHNNANPTRGDLSQLCDDVTNDANNYWHSSWSSSIGEYHYLQIALPEEIGDITSYKLKWITRNANNSPISLIVTTGATAEELNGDINWVNNDFNSEHKLLTNADNLPGDNSKSQSFKSWSSDVINFSSPIKTLGFRVWDTNTHAAHNGVKFFTLSEFKVYKEDGTEIELNKSNFWCNAVQRNDGQGVGALCDNNNTTFLHTTYDGNGNEAPLMHTLYIQLPEELSSLKISFDSRNNNNVPSKVELIGLNSSVEMGTYRIVSANTGFSSTKVFTGSLNNASNSAGWEGLSENDPEQYWSVSGNDFEGYTLQNYHFGDKKYLKTDLAKGSKSTLVGINNATFYTLKKLNDAGQYNIIPVKSTFPIHCANQADHYEQSTLTTWEGGENSPSSWTFEKVEEIKAAKVSLNSALDGATKYNVADNAIGSNPGQITTDLTLDQVKEKVTALNNSYTTAQEAYNGTDINAMQTAYASLVTAKANVPTPNAMVAGKYYRLKGSVSSTYAVAGDAGSQMPMAQLDNNNQATSIFYYNNDKLLAYGNGYYIYNTREIGSLGNASTWAFTSSSNKLGSMTIKATSGVTGGNGTWMYDNYNKVQKVDRIGAYAANNCDWFIEEVTNLPVSVSAAGYATLYAPVALTIPAGVEAYTVAFEDGKAKLTPITETIPANTGVVIEATEGTYNFAITTTDATATTALTGNVATANVDADATAYILGKGTQGVGFYKLNSTDRTIKGGRAYYTVPAGEATQAVAFLFDNTVTSIDAIKDALNEAKGAIYDLSGRKVTNAVKGGIYIKNGKKFIVK